MRAPVPPGWCAHEIKDGRGLFQVLVRRTRRPGVVDPHASPKSSGAAHNRSIAPGGSELPGAIERTRAEDFRVKPGISPRGHKTPMGPPSSGIVTPLPTLPVAGVVSAAPPSFGGLPSVRAMGTGRAGIVVGFDTEFTTSSGSGRVIDSYQFAVPDPLDPTIMVEVVILPLDDHRISLHAALWEAVVAARLWHSPPRARRRR